MTTTPVERNLPPGGGRPLFAGLGYVIRGLKTLPAPIRERLLDIMSGGVSSNLPPFPDVLRLVEAAGGMPDGKRWQERLAVERPHLRGVQTREIHDDSHGRVRARLYLPPADAPAPTAALVWVHGGAFVIGSLDQNEAHWPAVELAAAGIPVLSVDYRLCIAGVHYPTPQDDVISAWRWAGKHADHLGVSAAQLHLGGGSAGGCVVAGATLRLRDESQQLPASLYLAYPVLEGKLPNATTAMAEGLAAAKSPSDEWLRCMFANWAGSAPWDDPYVSPGRAELTGLPPTYVLTCGRDALRRSSEPFVARLLAADVSVAHDVAPDSEHAPFDRPGSADGDHALQRLGTWLTGGVSALNSERSDWQQQP